MAIEFTKPVIIGLIVVICILMFVMIVQVVPCSSNSSESFTSTTTIESILRNISNENEQVRRYTNKIQDYDKDIESLYDTMYIIKNRINELPI
jgi:hypothetical protein